jgi:hypothetical protein
MMEDGRWKMEDGSWKLDDEFIFKTVLAYFWER